MTIEEDKQLVYNNMDGKIVVYKYLLERLLKKCQYTKSRLDMYREHLHNGNMFIQLSVIYLSSASTFIQALSSQNYEVIFSDISNQGLLNSTDSIDSDIEGNAEVEQNTFSTISPIITLSITSYSAAIIALGRHLKIDEQESNVSTLVDRFAELVNRIQFHIDNLKPWAYNKYYDTDDKKIEEWYQIEKKIEAKYIRLLEKKKELFTSYDKIIDTSATRRFKRLFKNLKKERQKENDSDSDEEYSNIGQQITDTNFNIKEELDKFIPEEKEKEDDIELVIESIKKEDKKDKEDKGDKEDKDELDKTPRNRDTRSQTPPRSRLWGITNFMNY